MPKISIVMPSLNVAAYIRECVESVLHQSMADLEILCVDAGSTDGTWEILEDYAKKDERIRLVHSDKKSYGYQMNLGIRLSKGEYIGIVETDDAIEPDMYERLMQAAEKEHLDYVKSEFRSFHTLQNGHRVYNNYGLLYRQWDCYGRVLTPYEHDYLAFYDRNLWNGIYRKTFLTENEIVFQETPGAACQDVGFVAQTTLCADRAMYLDCFGYCYRTDRAEASSHNPKGIRYIYEEFTYLYQVILKKNKKMAERSDGLYYRLLTYVGEFEKWVRANQYTHQLEDIRDMCEWLEAKISEGMEKGILREGEMFGMEEKLGKLLREKENYIEDLKREDGVRKETEEKWSTDIAGRHTVIFGAGAYGRQALDLLDGIGISICVFCDNNREKWGSECYGIPIISPAQAASAYKDCCYVIASKADSETMKQQLLEAGVSEHSILLYSKI